MTAKHENKAWDLIFNSLFQLVQSIYYVHFSILFGHYAGGRSVPVHCMCIVVCSATLNSTCQI